VADEKIRYVLEVDDKGTTKLVKFGTAAEKSSNQAKKGFAGASKAIGDFGGQIPGVSGAMSSFAGGPAVAAGAAVAALGVGFGAMVKKSIDMADNMNDLSLRLGISTERLSVLSLYADQSGTDIETLSSAMGKLGVKMASGDETLKSYGVTAGSVDEALFQLADKVAKTEDPMLRLKSATDAFGKSGQQMLPLLAQGGDALRGMAADAPIVSSEMAKMADEFNDRMSALSGRFQSVGLGIAQWILPEMEKWLSGVERIANALGLVGDAEKRNQKITEGRAKIISQYAAVMEKDAADRKRFGLGERTSAVRLDGMTLQDALAAYDRNNKRSSGAAPASATGKFGSGATGPAKRPGPNNADYYTANGIDYGEYQYRYNEQRKSNYQNSLIASGDTGSEAKFQQGAIGAVDGAQAESTDFLGMYPDYYAGLPMSEKAKASTEEQYDKESAIAAEKARAQQAQVNSAIEAMRSDFTGAFSSAYADIWRNGRDVFSSLYDAFSEKFTSRAIDALANLSANFLFSSMGAPPGGGTGILSLLGFASGGTPPVGQPIEVGERRREVFIPQGPGRIQPTEGGGNTYNITVSNPTEARSLLRGIKSDERRRNTGIR